MADGRPTSEPTELIYLPRSSWYPALLAAGLAAVLASLFTWWPYGAIGAVVALAALAGWIRESREEFGRLPRAQRITSAPLPPTTLREKR
jgi:hypothetical protein